MSEATSSLGFVEWLPHIQEPPGGLMKKFRIEDAVEIAFSRKVVFRDLEGLLKKTLFQFDQESVIPRKDGDFEIGAGNFTDNAHKGTSVTQR